VKSLTHMIVGTISSCVADCDVEVVVVMLKLRGLGAVKRVAQKRESNDSSDEDNMRGNAKTADEPIDPFANVFDDDDEEASIASRVSRRRSSARFSQGGFNVSFTSPVKDNEPMPKRRKGSSVKKAGAPNEVTMDKENTDNGESASIEVKYTDRKSSKGSNAPLRTLNQGETGKRNSTSKRVSSGGLKEKKNSDNSKTILSNECITTNNSTVADQEPRPWCLEDFSVGKSIGRGKFGNVYLAKQKLTSKGGQTTTVALKTLHKSALINAKIVHNLRREVEIQSRLKHPNIVQLYGYFENTKTVSLILQYIEGGEMYKHVNRNFEGGCVPEWLCRTFMHDVLSALDYMHTRHVYHRDLKGENLFLHFQFDVSNSASNNSNSNNNRDSSGGGAEGEECPEHVRVMIGDLGASAHAPPPNATRHTWCGTYEYLSPEMVNRSGHQHHIDLWACGVLMYELLAGCTPFSHILEEDGHVDTVAEKNAKMSLEEAEDEEDPPIFTAIRRHQFGAVQWPAWLDTSSDTRDLVNTFLHPDPNMRPSAAQALESNWMKQAPLCREYSSRRLS